MTTRDKGFYHNRYSIAGQTDRPLLPHQQRDQGAAGDVAELLIQAGHRKKGEFFNYPNSRAEHALEQVTEDDVILQTTRIPRDDDPTIERPTVKPSASTLERIIFRRSREVIDIYRRQLVQISARFVPLLAEADRERARIGFHHKNVADYKSLNHFGCTCPNTIKNSKLTMGYAFRLQLWASGPDMLYVSGMGGRETQALAHIVRERYPDLVRSGGHFFAMIEMTYGALPFQPDDLSYIDTWDARFVLCTRQPLTCDVPLGSFRNHSDRSGQRVAMSVP